MGAVYTNEAEKARDLLADLLGRHREELLPLLGREAA